MDHENLRRNLKCWKDLKANLTSHTTPNQISSGLFPASLKNVSQGLLQYVLSGEENGNWTVIHMQNLDGRKIKFKKHTTRDKRKPKARAVNELT